MDDKDFRKHLADLAHGHHHPEEHDWGDASTKVTGEHVITKRPANAGTLPGLVWSGKAIQQ